jgi:hypothetical protein
MGAVLSNVERGLPDAKCGGSVGCPPAGADRATSGRGLPAADAAGDTGRFVTYRFEDTVPEAPQSARRTIYPYWAPVGIPSGQAAPDRIDVGAGIVAVKAEPTWRPVEEPRLSPPPLISAPKPPIDLNWKPYPPPLSPPPLVAAPPPPGPDPTPARPCPPGYRPTKSGKACIETDEFARARDETEKNQELRRAIRDYSDATFDEGFENAKKVAKAAGTIIPGPAGRAFKIAEKVFEGVHDAYVGARLVEELVVEMNQPEALAKGGKELLKKGEDQFEKRADPVLDKILKRRGIALPKEARKYVIMKARE